jgi:hypothetical protein
VITPRGATFLATVCNATPSAVPYALWLCRNNEEYLVDLSSELGQTGDCGLTGITFHGGKIYVAVQSITAGRILILDRSLAPVGVIANPGFVDIHSIHAEADSLLVCSTGAQSVMQVNLTDHSTTKLCEFEAKIHLNSACYDGAELLVCCHHPSNVIPRAFRGGVINALRREVALVGLGQPHSLCGDDGGFLVLDSDAHRVIKFDHTGIRQQQLLTGFLRGLAPCGGSLFIASSAGRVISRKSPSVPNSREVWDMAAEPVCIHELDAATLEIKARHFPLVAGFEIYDLLALEGDRAVDPPRERLLVPNIHAMARAYYESAKRALAAIH